MILSWYAVHPTQLSPRELYLRNVRSQDDDLERQGVAVVTKNRCEPLEGEHLESQEDCPDQSKG